ncbi:MAG TPA: hypothetical protein VG319_14245 [Polyangia bacterium]|nr:hypothetical protein [Polyangia bacterium]
MARKGDFWFLGVGLLALSAAACGGPTEDIGETSSYALAANALAANALAANALAANALAANALAANALAANALAANALAANALRDPLARQFLKYVVSCALPDDKSVTINVDGQSYTYPGLLGMEPQWGEDGGSCDESCQRWVTGCVLARVDHLGIERMISLRGMNGALRTSRDEADAYPVREATYYGNVFAKGQPLFACLSPGQTGDQRVCGDSLDDCPMDVVGSCASACAFEGPNGQFDFCSTSGKAFRPETYRESVTVFLPKPGR